MPLKRVTLEVADEVDPLAAAVGAANTLVLTTGRRTAHNTDVIGICGALGAVTGRAVVLGAGGTAQAALAALSELGINDIEVLVRDLARTGELRTTAERLGVRPRINDALTDIAGASALLADADVVISTLPHGGADVFTPPGEGSVVLDVEYAPWPTGFAAAAMARGRARRERAGDAAAPGCRPGGADDRQAGSGHRDAGRPRRGRGGTRLIGLARSAV